MNKCGVLKKVFLAIARVSVFVMALVGVYSLIFAFPVNNAKFKVCDFSVDNGLHSINVFQVGEPFTFGSHNVEIYCDGELYFSTVIYNDGKSLSERNFGVVSKDGETILTVKGEEQKDKTYVIRWDSMRVKLHTKA